jgi:hypothetical protein
VTVAEVRPGEPPRLDLFGQRVALGREVMRRGSPTTPRFTGAVALAGRSRIEEAAVRLGLAARVSSVRQIEMPTMTRDELGSASSSRRPS